jgi:hypothetical protein
MTVRHIFEISEDPMGWPPLSYTILLEDLHGKKKWSQKHGGFRPLLTPSPWQLVRISHGNYHWPGSDLRPLQFPHPPWFSLKNFRFLQFCSGFVVFSRYLNRFLKCFRDIFSKFGYWFKDVKVVRVILPGKDNKIQTSLSSQNMTQQSQRGYLNQAQRAINRYFIQFYLCFILSHIKLVKALSHYCVSY